MTKRSLHRLLCGLIGVMSCCGVKLTAAHAVGDAPPVTDTEEYAVFAAVLFPGEPDATEPASDDPEKRGYHENRRARLSGIPTNGHNLSDLTVAGSQPEKGPDQDMIADYNRRNSQACRIDKEKLLKFMPKRGHLTLVTQGYSTISGEGKASRGAMTYISRPGFNPDRTKAVIQINHVADFEMGAGYLVYLENSSKSGRWVLVDSVLNRRY